MINQFETLAIFKNGIGANTSGMAAKVAYKFSTDGLSIEKIAQGILETTPTVYSFVAPDGRLYDIHSGKYRTDTKWKSLDAALLWYDNLPVKHPIYDFGYKEEDITPEYINTLIKDSGVDTNLISDGYHTIGELYEHRYRLWISYCEMVSASIGLWTNKPHGLGLHPVVMTKKNHDGSEWDGWFLLAVNDKRGQLSYHLPIKFWAYCSRFAEVIERNDKYDGHTSEDVLERLVKI